jgi:hypothetical protein
MITSDEIMTTELFVYAVTDLMVMIATDHELNGMSWDEAKTLAMIEVDHQLRETRYDIKLMMISYATRKMEEMRASRMRLH